jgi:hypothetical protein
LAPRAPVHAAPVVGGVALSPKLVTECEAEMHTHVGALAAQILAEPPVPDKRSNQPDEPLRRILFAKFGRSQPPGQSRATASTSRTRLAPPSRSPRLLAPTNPEWSCFLGGVTQSRPFWARTMVDSTSSLQSARYFVAARGEFSS